MGVKKMQLIGRSEAQFDACCKLQAKQRLDKIAAYHLIRILCSPQLNFLLSLDEEFSESGENDALLYITNRLLIAGPNGN